MLDPAFWNSMKSPGKWEADWNGPTVPASEPSSQACGAGRGPLGLFAFVY